MISRPRPRPRNGTERTRRAASRILEVPSRRLGFSLEHITKTGPLFVLKHGEIPICHPFLSEISCTGPHLSGTCPARVSHRPPHMSPTCHANSAPVRTRTSTCPHVTACGRLVSRQLRTCHTCHSCHSFHSCHTCVPQVTARVAYTPHVTLPVRTSPQVPQQPP